MATRAPRKPAAGAVASAASVASVAPVAPVIPAQGAANSAAPDLGAIYERIWTAIMDHSLPPSTRLVEDKLCEIFGVGRTRIRQVLQRLAHEGVVTLMPNRGAIVAKPTVEEARDVFEARQAIEAAIVSKYVRSATRADHKRIREHLAREKAAWRAKDRRAIIQLSGDFHIILAEIAGNAILLESLRELVSRSSLIIAVYQAPGATPCPPDEHNELVSALEQNDPAAVELMRRHLDHVQDDLDLDSAGDGGVDLKSVFSDVLNQS